MALYTENQPLRITAEQKNSLKILESYKVNVSQFIRLAIKEKIKRDYKNIKNNNYTPF